MLNQLELEGVGPAQHLTIDFKPRLNFLTGDNGLGKSFVLDIAWWVLTAGARQGAQPRGSGAAVRPHRAVQAVQQQPQLQALADGHGVRCDLPPGLSTSEGAAAGWGAPVTAENKL